MSLPAAIELVDGAAGYGRTQVFESMSLKVEPGACLAVAGPNGAGKSTLLKAIAGALPLWRGELQVDGIIVTELTAEDRIRSGVVLCPEGRRIFSTLSVEENLMVGATPLHAALGRGPARRRIEEGLARAYEMFPILGERRGGSGGALSGGQQSPAP
jgi:branched-chain amino acid transport system ATP-binding protein